MTTPDDSATAEAYLNTYVPLMDTPEQKWAAAATLRADPRWPGTRTDRCIDTLFARAHLDELEASAVRDVLSSRGIPCMPLGSAHGPGVFVSAPHGVTAVCHPGEVFLADRDDLRRR